MIESSALNTQDDVAVVIGLKNGRINATGRDALLNLTHAPNLQAITMRPENSREAVVCYPPFSEKTDVRLCRYMENWRYNGRIVVQGHRRNRPVITCVTARTR